MVEIEKTFYQHYVSTEQKQDAQAHRSVLVKKLYYQGFSRSYL